MSVKLNETQIELPSVTTAERDAISTPKDGYITYNSTTGGLEFYDETNGWSSLGVVDGSSASSAFSSTSQVAGFGYTGIRTLWFTAGNNTTPFQVEVDFDTAGGPWILVSFDFTNGGWDAYNDTVYVHAGESGASGNHQFNSAARYDDGADLGLGDGTLRMAEMFGAYIGAVTDDISGRGAIAGTYPTGYSGPYTVNYYNHATGSNFTTAQVAAMQNWVSNLYSGIPHVAGTHDDDNDTTEAAWDSQSVPPTIGQGHYIFIRDIDNNWQRATASNAATSQESTFYTWTESSYNQFITGGSYSNSSASGATALYTSKMILPKQISSISGSGGGAEFGTPWVRNFRSSAGNIRNSRTYFLVK